MFSENYFLLPHSAYFVIAPYSYCVKSVRIRGFSGRFFPAFGLNTEYLSLFNPNARKYRPEKLQIGTFFMQWVPFVKF